MAKSRAKSKAKPRAKSKSKSKPKPIMNQILYNGTIPTGLYVGASSAAAHGHRHELKKADIHGILNVAYEVNDKAFSYGEWTLEFDKVGLYDSGPKPGKKETNQAGTIKAAVYMLDQLITRLYPLFPGNILVHCESGGSRSLTVAALWMAQRLPITPTPGDTRFMTAVNCVRTCRGFDNGPYNPAYPVPPGYEGGKPMAALFHLGQAIDESTALFPSKIVAAAEGG